MVGQANDLPSDGNLSTCLNSHSIELPILISVCRSLIFAFYLKTQMVYKNYLKHDSVSD